LLVSRGGCCPLCLLLSLSGLTPDVYHCCVPSVQFTVAGSPCGLVTDDTDGWDDLLTFYRRHHCPAMPVSWHPGLCSVAA